MTMLKNRVVPRFALYWQEGIDPTGCGVCTAMVWRPAPASEFIVYTQVKLAFAIAGKENFKLYGSAGPDGGFSDPHLVVVDLETKREVFRPLPSRTTWDDFDIDF